MIHPAQFAHIEAALSQILCFSQPADAVLSHYFRTHPKLGAQDRHFIAEVTFACLRRHALAIALIKPARITARRLVLATLARIYHTNLKEFAGCLNAQEREWVAMIKGKAISDTLALQAELPEWIIERLADQSPEAVIRLGQGFMQAAKLDLRVNTLKMKRDDVLSQLLAQGIDATATVLSPIGIRLTGRPAINRHPFFTQGVIEVQDEGSQLLGLITGARRGEMVVDFCAGAGGKTLLLGAQMASTGRLYAFDVSATRLAKLKPRLARCGLSNVHPQRIAHENDTIIKRLAGKVDRVLIDAPCSGLGTLRRNPDIKFRQSPTSIDELSVKQTAILESASTLLKPGGRLVYATCSLLPQENQRIVEAFLAHHGDFTLLPMAALLAELNINLDTGVYLELTPDQHNTDGFFAAALVRAKN